MDKRLKELERALYEVLTRDEWTGLSPTEIFGVLESLKLSLAHVCYNRTPPFDGKGYG